MLQNVRIIDKHVSDMESTLAPSEAAARKRRRTRVACEPCRTRKRKCNGSKPICYECYSNSEACVYRDPVARPRFIFKNASLSKPKSSNGKLSSLGNTPLESDDCALPTESSSCPDLPPASSSVEIQHGKPPPLTTGDRAQFRIPFFRWFGPTGIAPGYKKFLVDVKHDSNKNGPSSTTHLPPSHDMLFPAVGKADSGLFDDVDNITPRAEILFPLLDIFFDYYACHFPFHSRDPFIQSVRDKKVPALLLNSICALAARFSELPVFRDQLPYVRGEAFAVKAKHLLVPHLNLPSFEVVESILMIAWTELGTCHDVGLWMYTGMAVRMAEDLGMHKTTDLSVHGGISGGDEGKVSSDLFWMINFLDHIICFATGRPLTTRRECIAVPLPEEDRADEDGLRCPFPAMIRVMQTKGVVNEQLGTQSDHVLDLSAETRSRLMRCGEELVAYYTNLHPTLAFDVQNFRAHASKGQSGTFLLLHLWFNAVMIALHRPGLRFGQENQSDNNFLCAESRQIALSSARTTSSIINLAELVDPKAIVGSPFIDQAVEIAGLEFIAEMQVPRPVGTHSATLQTLEGFGHQSNYQTCLRVLQTLLVHWRGIAWILTTMEQKYKGVGDTDPGEDSADPNSLVSLHDNKMVQRLLSKVGRSTDNSSGSNIHCPDSTIGIAVAGTTNMPSKGTITVVESAQPTISEAQSTSAPTVEGASWGNFCDEFEKDWSWTSWVDENLFDNLDFYQNTAT